MSLIFDIGKKTPFGFWECLNFDALNQLGELPTKSYLLGVRFLIVTFMKEIKPVFTEKYHFGNRDESILRTLSRKVCTLMILKQRSVSIVFQLNPIV